MRWELFLMCCYPAPGGSALYAIIECPTYRQAWKLARKICKDVHTSRMRIERAL